ncbi:hypothetical protein bcere0016_54510 [Bacillus cereus 95/8201]|uniref:hypothetical protein n=1 Tax=Bacillus cereus group TaxID=86661 RepID=UPI0001A08CF3|nr:hypothetical protein [Bacillus cereus]AJH60158.1 hypothetical protein BG11_5774 [Bacillus cereus]AJK31943.1 hypothetical protein BF33_5819 [Bacillus cereus]EEL13969.1 hypothetical protein bcere0016_54510 [Bacillus cereus 95/8201]QKH64100.1 hypothetical protein FOC75_00290 [Bacillus cereus]QKH71735.1 hypothetical protein FOC74_01635 [Bacillus cereus]
MLLDFEVMEFGFTKEDIENISNHFEYTLDLLDWEDIKLFKSDEEIFKYFFIDDQDKESIVETLLEMGKVSAEDLEDGETVMGYMVDDGDETVFKLSNGRWAVFSHELLGKEARQQMD